MDFIEQIAELVQKYAPQYDIKVHSPIIAQAILESGKGTSELAVKANNYFGLKYRPGRCPTAIGSYAKVGSEQNKDGTYTSSQMTWMKFENMEQCVIGYFDFINIPDYKNLKGVTEPKKYLELIKADGYATSLKYVDNLMNVINSYGLTKYDEKEQCNKSMRVNVHAGHNPDGKVACGSVGYLNESDENRKVCVGLIEKIKQAGHIAYDCTCNNGTSQKDVLQKIVAKCNAHTVDLDISIHFNAVSKESTSDSKTKGVEVWIHPSNKGTEVEKVAASICQSVSKLGFTNRGVKYSDTLYVLKNTKAPAMLIECCFVDDVDDAALYNCNKMVQAIFEGLSLNNVNTSISKAENVDKVEEKMYYVIVGVYKSESNAKAFAEKLATRGYLADDAGNLIKGIVTQIKNM